MRTWNEKFDQVHCASDHEDAHPQASGLSRAESKLAQPTYGTAFGLPGWNMVDVPATTNLEQFDEEQGRT